MSGPFRDFLIALAFNPAVLSKGDSSGEKVVVLNGICLINEQAKTRPEALALLAGDSAITYAALDSAAAGAAATLSAQFPPGRALAITADASIDFVVTLVAALRSGLCVCPLNPQLPEAAQHEINERLGLVRIDAPEPHAAMAPSPALAGAATIVLSSGSTGKPKAVVHAYNNHIASARAANVNIALAPGDRWLLSLPLYHVSGLAILFRCWLAGATVVLPGATPLGEALEQYRITHLSLVATQLRRLVAGATSRVRLSSLKAILLGGGPVPTDLVRAAHEGGLPIHKSYGMTETASQITATRPDATLEELLTAGAPVTPGTVRISADAEIQVSGESLFLGYLEEGRLNRPLDEEGFFATGDIGAFDARENLVVHGRRDNMFISGGENVYPEEIERVLMNLPEVEQALVVPVEDDEFGARALAFVDLSPEFTFQPKRLEEAVASHLPRYKVPRLWLPWPQQVQRGIKPARAEFRRIAAQFIESKERTACAIERGSQERGYV